MAHMQARFPARKVILRHRYALVDIDCEIAGLHMGVHASNGPVGYDAVRQRREPPFWFPFASVLAPRRGMMVCAENADKNVSAFGNVYRAQFTPIHTLNWMKERERSIFSGPM